MRRVAVALAWVLEAKKRVCCRSMYMHMDAPVRIHTDTQTYHQVFCKIRWLVVGLAPATLEFWVRFPNERNQGKRGPPPCVKSTGFLTGPSPALGGLQIPAGLVVGMPNPWPCSRVAAVLQPCCSRVF